MIPRRLQAVECLAGVEGPPARGDLGDGGLEIEGAGGAERLAKRTRFLRGLARLRRASGRVFNVRSASARFETFGPRSGALWRPSRDRRLCGGQRVGRHGRGADSLPPLKQGFDRFEGLRGDVFAARNAALDFFGVRAQSLLKVPCGRSLRRDRSGSCGMDMAPSARRRSREPSRALPSSNSSRVPEASDFEACSAIARSSHCSTVTPARPAARSARRRAPRLTLAISHAVLLLIPRPPRAFYDAARARARRLGRDHSFVTVKKRLRARLNSAFAQRPAAGCEL